MRRGDTGVVRAWAGRGRARAGLGTECGATSDVRGGAQCRLRVWDDQGKRQAPESSNASRGAVRVESKEELKVWTERSPLSTPSAVPHAFAILTTTRNVMRRRRRADCVHGFIVSMVPRQALGSDSVCSGKAG